LEPLEPLSREQLIQVILDQHRMIGELRAEIEQLKKRGGAAPFSKGTRKANPKLPGRKAGEGPFLRRGEPVNTLAETILVTVGTRCCPDCSGALEPGGTELATVTDIEEMPQPVVRRYEVEICRCLKCGRRVRGRHRDLAAGQHGETAHRLGLRVKAAAYALHYNSGVPLRKIPSILKELTGVVVTQGADPERRVMQTLSWIR
jgi:transposase